MLWDPTSAAETGSMTSRPPTPIINDHGRIESLATIRNRRTWQLLMWFPMTVCLDLSSSRPELMILAFVPLRDYFVSIVEIGGAIS
jgi:hypothetical protein